MCQAVLGNGLREVLSNTRAQLAVDRQSAEFMLSQVIAAPEVGGQLTGVIGGLRQARAHAAPEVGASLTGVIRARR